MIDYKGFIEDNFLIINKSGETVPFIFNDQQNYTYQLLLDTWKAPTGPVPLNGVRENWLKYRQWGGSSLIDGIFTVDFIYSELGRIPMTNADIVSHNEKATKDLFARPSFFLDSYLAKNNYRREDFLQEDSNLKFKGRRGAEFVVQTASAKVSGRGGTKQNIHWSEVSFYPQTEIMNAAQLVKAAEEQVMQGVGKIFRETTGGMEGDYFHTEYKAGQQPDADFVSRFFGWWMHKEYTRPAPLDWVIPEYYSWVIREHKVTKDQCYWHHRKIHKYENGQWILDVEKLREYPSSEEEAFLSAGRPFFDREAMIHYTNMMRKPIVVREIFV